MSEIDTELASWLVTGRKRDGRCTYDPQAKAEIIEQCLRPGASVSRIGMLYGINANLLRTWMGKRHVSAHAKSALAVKRAPHEAQFVAFPDGHCKFPHPWPPQIPPGRRPGL
jgi:transposase